MVFGLWENSYLYGLMYEGFLGFVVLGILENSDLYGFMYERFLNFLGFFWNMGETGFVWF